MAGKRKLTQDDGAQDAAPISPPMDGGEVPYPWPPVEPVEAESEAATVSNNPLPANRLHGGGRVVLAMKGMTTARIKMAGGELIPLSDGVWVVGSARLAEALVFDEMGVLWRVIADADGVRFIRA